ncbi:ComEC/Rec2 family competence protein [Paenibacillus cremeus]|uniref:ComEC family DNA internalization-related competence protein n=1 Tax=Paenibacillus cremeus TaxID=2163881 RepID=A0A559KAA8_9BACL|nr:ComEC/Rec2 family competence protein [Paenibacillus cremeus]TVY09065.1 ComEC family DNA internalization-related competence protein [Paenibacillus cremeus]
MNDRPVAGVALCFVLGYVLALVWPSPWFTLYLTLGAGVLGCAVLLFQPAGKMLLLGALIITGAAGWYGETTRHNVSAISIGERDEAEVRLSGRILTPVTVDGDRVSLQAAAVNIDAGDGSVTPVSAEGERLQLSIRLLEKEEQDAAKGWQRGDRIVLSGTLKPPAEARNFGGFDYRRYLFYQRVHWQVNAKGLGSVHVTPPGQGEWGLWLPLRWNDRLRDLSEQVETLFPQDQSGFMKGMLIGITDEIDPKQFDLFSQLGLTHIIAISGLNVAIFLGCILWLLRRLGLARETYYLIAIGVGHQMD